MSVKKPQKLYPYTNNQALDKDIKNLYDWVSRLEVVTTNPDGSRTGRYDGEAVKLKTGGKTYLEVCDGAGTTTWLGVELTNTP